MTLKIGLWIARIIATVLIVCLLSIWTTSYVVTSYVQALLEEYEIPLDVKPVALADVWKMIWGADEQSTNEQLTDAAGEKQSNVAELLEEQETAKMDEIDNDANDEEEALSESEPTLEVFAPIEAGVEPSITPEQIIAKKEGLDTEEKERMFEIIVGKLPPESWQVFSSAVEDGLTDQELLEVQQLMAQHLTREEYDELMALLSADEQ